MKALACAGLAAFTFGGAVRNFGEGDWVWGIIGIVGAFGWACWSILLSRPSRERRR